MKAPKLHARVSHHTMQGEEFVRPNGFEVCSGEEWLTHTGIGERDEEGIFVIAQAGVMRILAAIEVPSSRPGHLEFRITKEIETLAPGETWEHKTTDPESDENDILRVTHISPIAMAVRRKVVSACGEDRHHWQTRQKPPRRGVKHTPRTC